MPGKKWNAENRNVRVGDFVMVADPNALREKWRMDKVVQVFPAEDSVERNVQVKMAAGTYTRPKVIQITIGFPHGGKNVPVTEKRFSPS